VKKVITKNNNKTVYQLQLKTIMNTKDIPQELAVKLAIALKHMRTSQEDDALIMNVINKTEPTSQNMTRFRIGFPEYVAMHLEWLLTFPDEKFFNKYLLED